MKTALVLGGYGLIGSACCRALAKAGYQVTGLGRSRRAALAAAPDQGWIIKDLPTIETAQWRDILARFDVVVNAAGALQDGPADDLQAIHATLLARLCAAAPPGLRLVQISAAGASPQASTAFFRTKAMGDAHVMQAPCAWVILRPTLVLAPQAYGGTALLRGAAALPGLLPQVFPQSPVQTVHIEDLAAAVVAAASPAIPSGTIADITEPASHPLPDILLQMRRWLGLPPPALGFRVPSPLLTAVGAMADALGWLGWRTPLRSTALRVLQDGIHGTPEAWLRAGGSPARSFAESLSSLPATSQERLFARLYFVLPLAIVTLAGFWIATGLITLAHPAAAAAVLQSSPLPPVAIPVITLGGAVLDILLGLALLWRRCSRKAALGMVGLSLVYLFGGTMVLPGLWLDPLGPLVKVLPSIILALIVWLGVEDR